MKYLSLSLVIGIFLLCSCSTEEASEHERTYAAFLDSLGSGISPVQWWRTSVSLKINVTTNDPVQIRLLSSGTDYWVLYDYKEVSASGSVVMTVPQGQGEKFYLDCICKNRHESHIITLTGKSEETINLDFTAKHNSTRSATTPPTSLCGNSIIGDAQYYQFSDNQLADFDAMMDLSVNNVDAKNVLGLNCNYELESNGPFYITWVNGYEAEQRSRILGYYYHSPTTYEDIVYVDLSETHKWDYIDGLAKVQYQIGIEDRVDGHVFMPNTWYDANFDMHDTYGSTWANNMDRVGDNAYNSQMVYMRYEGHLTALRGISFKVDVPEGKRIGFYLRSDEEPYPNQWSLLQSKGIRPYVANAADFKGTCFCAEFMNIVGNGRGLHRSFVKDYDEVIWMGMEDLVEGGDHDCNDVIFGVVADLEIFMPTIVDPELQPSGKDALLFPWTLAFEDVNRNPDFDFNDAVIKLLPDYENERCCVSVMAAGSTSRMYLHYDGPDGDVNFGEIHELMKSKLDYINTKSSLAGTPFVELDCVPWPKGYTMAKDAKRFYIEIQRGSCDDCSDVITLPEEPGKMPEAILVAGEWQWPKEGVHIMNAYDKFHGWAEDVTQMPLWDWYKSAANNSSVSY
jgi:hypothetical protein